MSLDQHIQKIDRYLSKSEGRSLVVDVQNDEDQKRLIQHYHVGQSILISASNYCAHDEFPRLDALLNDLSTKDGIIIVTGVTSFLKLQGEQELRRFIQQLLTMYVKGNVIFITYQCKRFLPTSDTRIGRRIIIMAGEATAVPKLVFTASEIPLPKKSHVISGLEKLEAIEDTETDGVMYVITEKNKKSFPNTLYHLSSIDTAYEAILIKDAITSTLPQKIGTDNQWNYALALFEGKSNWAEVIDAAFGNHSMLELFFSSYKKISADKKWLYFVALKLYGAKGDWCLDAAARLADDITEFNRQIYRCILEKSPKDSDFWDCYKSRKAILREIDNSGMELASYCRLVFSKGINAIYYFTDNTQKEQESIFAFLDQYGLDMGRKKLLEIIQKVYPALYSYLRPYRFGNALLDRYFTDYKYQKVINKILPEFEAEVETQAEKREYNYMLPPRSSVIEKLERSDAQLYFMDAMGVEYLSYITSMCQEFKLIISITVCAAELPTITSRNKEFMELFADAEKPIVSIKELDDIKHHGKYDYDFYKNSKLPIHLIKELDVIRSVLEKIRNDLYDGKIKRAFLIADHGSSRLAVIHDSENIWEMHEKGKHSGRCCLKSDVDEKPSFAADAGDFWALANYDRFKGSRKANVEVHGGATLEELCVPVIELSCLTEMPEIILMPLDQTDAGMNKVPEIVVSFRKKAALKIFSTISLKNVGLVVNGKHYQAVELGNNFYSVDMPELKKQGTYYTDVYSGDNVIATNMPFVIKKEGQQERSLL